MGCPSTAPRRRGGSVGGAQGLQKGAGGVSGVQGLGFVSGSLSSHGTAAPGAEPGSLGPLPCARGEVRRQGGKYGVLPLLHPENEGCVWPGVRGAWPPWMRGPWGAQGSEDAPRGAVPASQLFFFWLGISCRDLEGVVRAWRALWGAPHVPQWGGDTRGAPSPTSVPWAQPQRKRKGPRRGNGAGESEPERKEGGEKEEAGSAHTPRNASACPKALPTRELSSGAPSPP